VSKNKPRTYTLEFKKESAKLALNSEQSINRTASDLGISHSALHGWIKKFFPKGNSVISETTTNFELENKQLKKELSRVKQERDILKKATAYFAGEVL
jgi:transposase